jgi:hypothetical protein
MNGLLERFKGFYGDLKNVDLGQLDQIYAEGAVFKDPVHEIRGLSAIHRYMEDLCSNVEVCRFEFLDQLETEGGAYFKWNMHFRHPGLGGKPITVRGMTQVQFKNGLVCFHEDIYDMGAMIYEHVPVLGSVTRWLKRRLAA